MFLISSIEVWFVVIFLSLGLAFLFFLNLARKKRKQLGSSHNFVKKFFEKYPELRTEEYVPTKNRPLNRKNNNIYLASSFLLALDGTKTKKIDYKDIYWVYGIVPKNSRLRKANNEALVICSIKGNATIFLSNQDQYVKYFYSLGILTGYTKERKTFAKKRKKIMKKDAKEGRNKIQS